MADIIVNVSSGKPALVAIDTERATLAVTMMAGAPGPKGGDGVPGPPGEPGLTTVIVDNTTITGNGTTESPLSAVSQLTASMLAFLTRVSVSSAGLPLWDGATWPGGGIIGDPVTYMQADYVEAGYVV